MFIAGGGHMDYHVSIQVGLGVLGSGRHIGGRCAVMYAAMCCGCKLTGNPERAPAWKMGGGDLGSRIKKRDVGSQQLWFVRTGIINVRSIKSKDFLF